MTADALPRDTFMPRAPGGTAPGVGLSVLVHAGLIVAIAFGVSWRSRVPEARQAELWAVVPQAAAPRAVEPAAEPVLAPQPAPPRPLPKVEPAPPAPAPLPDAQIAIEKARAEKAKAEKLRREQEAAEREREASKQKKLAADKAERAAKAEKERTRQQKKLEAQKKLQQALDEREAKLREAERAKQLQRIQGLAGASGDAGATGSALKSAGPSASYAGRIVARVRPNIVFADEVSGNPSADVEVRVAPDGTILGRRLVKSSGVAAYDNAVLRAIDKTEVLPRDVDGRVPPTLTIGFRLRE